MFIPKQQQSKLARSRHCRLPEATIMKLLHIDSSALGSTSASWELSAAIVARWRADLPGMSVQYRDLDSDPLPHLDEIARASCRARACPSVSIWVVACSL